MVSLRFMRIGLASSFTAHDTTLQVAIALAPIGGQ